MNPVRVVLADDHGIVRRGLRSILADDPRFEVVGEAADGEQALCLVRDRRPDVILLDLRMPGVDGVEACRRIAAISPQTAILILTAFFDRVLLEACLRNGARGYLLKDAENLHLAEHLLAVVQGHAALDPRAAEVVTEYLLRSEPSPDVLTAREMEVLHLMAIGLTNKEVGVSLSISENTVKGHLKAILAKLDARNRVDAVLRAKQRGLL